MRRDLSVGLFAIVSYFCATTTVAATDLVVVFSVYNHCRNYRIAAGWTTATHCWFGLE